MLNKDKIQSGDTKTTKNKVGGDTEEIDNYKHKIRKRKSDRG